MKKRLFYALLVTMFTACTLPEGFKDLTNNNNGVEQPSRPDYIYIDFEEETRVELNDDQKTIWSEGDQVVRLGTDISDVWEYTGLTGEDTNRFSFVGGLSTLENYDYNGKYYVFYSYDSFLEVIDTPDGPEILHEVATIQNYEPNTYDPKSSVMIAESTDSESFSLSNLVGYIHLPLTGDKTIKNIILIGNNDETLGGRRSFLMTDPEQAYWEDDSEKAIGIVCNEGVTLTQEATDFYITLMPTIFNKGFNMTIIFSDGTSETLNTDQKMTVERNKILHLNEVSTSPGSKPDSAQTITIKHKGDMVAFPILDNEYFILWGDEHSNVVDSYSDFFGSYVYDDGLSSHTITIYSDSANSFEINSCSGITEIDFSQF